MITQVVSPPPTVIRVSELHEGRLAKGRRRAIKHIETVDKENERLKEFADYVERIKGQSKPTAREKTQ
jgi:hypothetical protein